MSEDTDHLGSQQKVEIEFGGGETDHIVLDTELLERVEAEAQKKSRTFEEELTTILQSHLEHSGKDG